MPNLGKAGSIPIIVCLMGLQHMIMPQKKKRKALCKTDLGKAGSVHIALRLVEVKDSIVPGHVAVLQHMFSCSLKVSDEPLIGHDQHLAGKDGLPMLACSVHSLNLTRYVCSKA